MVHGAVLYDLLHVRPPGGDLGGGIILLSSLLAWFIAISIFVMPYKDKKNIEKPTMLRCTISMTLLGGVLPTIGLLLCTPILREIPQETTLMFAGTAAVIGLIDGLIFGLVLNKL
jgi:ABC-type amino acid transport system permease subunit